MSRSVTSLDGRRFGRIVVTACTERRVRGSAVWICQCDCGATFERPAHSLLAQKKANYPQFCSKSCVLRLEPREKHAVRVERLRILPQLVAIHRDLATARCNANLPPQLNTLGTDLQGVQARLEALVTSLGGGVYLEGEGWRR